MTRHRLLGIGLLAALAGCNSGSTNTAANQAPDPGTLAEAPSPTINAATYIAAGDLAATRNQWARASAQYEQALKVKADDPATLKKLALVYVKANQMPAALDTWKRYLTASKNSDDAFGSLGYAYELAGKPAEAEATYKLGLQAHPDGPLTHVNYGLMLVRRNEVEQAVKTLGMVLKPPEVNYNIAGVYAQLGRPDLAQFYYKRALECDPGFIPARQKLSMLDSER